MAKRKPTDPQNDTTPPNPDPNAAPPETESDDGDPGDEHTTSPSAGAAPDPAAPPRRAKVSLLRNGPSVSMHDATVIAVRPDGTATLEVQFPNGNFIYDLPRSNVLGRAGTWTPA